MPIDRLDAAKGRLQADLVTFYVADYPVAVLAAQCAGLAETAMALGEAEGRRAWLLGLLQCREQTALQSQHVLLLKGSKGLFPLAVDQAPVLERAGFEQLRPLPDAMAKAQRLAAVRGLWLHTDGLRLLLDPARLPDYPLASQRSASDL